jgi:hypothetical protein
LPDEKVYNDSVRDLPPPTLFKYRACHTPTFARDESIILGNALWAGSPLEFNDPFDCVPVIDLTGSAQERKAFAARQLAKRGGGLPRQQRRQENRRITKTIERRWNRIISARDAQEHWKSLLGQTGVACFAESPVDMPMWGYYADSHRGYVLEFATSAQPFMLANRVVYDAERPRFRVLDPDRKDLMERLLLRKAAVWGHEHEWRIVQAGRTEPLTFPPELLKSITFGANMPPPYEEALRAIIRRRGYDVEIKRAVLDPETFDLRVIPA